MTALQTARGVAVIVAVSPAQDCFFTKQDR